MEQLLSAHLVDNLEEPAPIHSRAPVGAPPTTEGLEDIAKGSINGKVPSKSHGLFKRSQRFMFRKTPDVASLPAVTTGAATKHQKPQFKATDQAQPKAINRTQSKAVEPTQPNAIEQPRSKAIEFSRWRDRLLKPHVASEREICIELERELSSDEKQIWDTFRQYLRSLAGDNTENKAEAQAFQPFRNRTRLSWRVVDIAEHEQGSSENDTEGQKKRTSPYICIEGLRTKENAQRLHGFLSQRKVRAEYHPPFKLCYSLAHIEAPFFPKVTLPREEGKTLYTLCGQLVLEQTAKSSDGYSGFTIGGLVQIGDGVFALSSWHDAISDEPSETDHGSGVSIKHLHDSTDYDEDFEPALILESESPGHEPSRMNQSLSEMALPMITTETSAVQLTDLVGDIVLAGNEWCLFSVENPSRHLPNCVSRTSAFAMLSPDTSTKSYIGTFAAKPVSGAVVVVGGRSGLVHARMSPNENDIFLPSGKVLEVWRITFDRGEIRRGDSGSWVVDLESGVVFGHIIAMTNNAAYVLPTWKIFKDIDSILGKTPGCRLVSAFDCLADLAKFHVKSSPAQAEASAREAISSEVLDHSRTSASVNLLKIYLKQGQRSSDEQSVLMELLMKSGSNLHHFIISGSALVQAEESQLANHDTPFRAVFNELRNIARLLQDMHSSSDLAGVEHSKSQRRASHTQSARPASVIEETRPSSEYYVEDLSPDINTSTDAWIRFSRMRFAHRKGLPDLLDTRKETDWDAIEREQRRVAYLRSHFGTDHVYSRDQGYLLDEIASAQRLWRKSAASRADALFQQGKHRALSIRDSTIVNRVRHWKDYSRERQKVYAIGAYDSSFPSDINFVDGSDEYALETGWGYAGMVSLDREAREIPRFENRRLPMKDLLSMASGPLSQTAAPWRGKPVEMNHAIRYFHLPENNTIWVEDFMSAYFKVSMEGDLSYEQSLMQMNPHPNNPFQWNGRQHEGGLAPVHARQIAPHSFTNLLPPYYGSSITESKRPDQYVALFIPFLSSEESSSVRRARDYIRAADATHAVQHQVPVAEEGTSRAREGKERQVNPLVDFIGRFRGRTPKKGLDQRTADSNAWQPVLPLARYLIYAAKLYKLFEEIEAVGTINSGIRGSLPIHMRRTLEQYRNWPSADNTDRQDMEQTTRVESLRQRKVRKRDGVHALSSPLIMVDQLWLWILNDKTILSSFPRSWGDRHGQSPIDVYSHISHRLENAHPGEIESAYDVALVIVEECSKALFRQETGVDVMNLYGSALSRLATSTSAAYNVFKTDAQAASVEDTLASMGRLLRRSQGLAKEWRTLDEVHRAMKELDTMDTVLSHQIDVLTEFECILQELDHEKTKNRVAVLVKDITTRRSEVKHLNGLAEAVMIEFRKMQDLQQQQVSTAHARIALQGVYEQSHHHASSPSSTTPRYRINSKGRVVSVRGRGFIEKNKGKERGSSAVVDGDDANRPSVWARIGEAVGLRKRGKESEKRLGAGTTTTSRMV